MGEASCNWVTASALRTETGTGDRDRDRRQEEEEEKRATGGATSLESRMSGTRTGMKPEVGILRFRMSGTQAG